MCVCCEGGLITYRLARIDYCVIKLGDPYTSNFVVKCVSTEIFFGMSDILKIIWFMQGRDATWSRDYEGGRGDFAHKVWYILQSDNGLVVKHASNEALLGWVAYFQSCEKCYETPTFPMHIIFLFIKVMNRESSDSVKD